MLDLEVDREFTRNSKEVDPNEKTHLQLIKAGIKSLLNINPQRERSLSTSKVFNILRGTTKLMLAIELEMFIKFFFHISSLLINITQ